jgi:DNA-binding MarR family transcriptional regulator
MKSEKEMLVHSKTLGHSIGILLKRFTRMCERGGREIGLTGAQGKVLAYIFIEEQWQDMFQKDIEEEFDIRRSSATGILQSLERDGMIYRVSVPQDARLKKIVLTDKARQIQKTVLNGLELLEVKLKGDLAEEEIKAFVQTCDRIGKNIESF